MFEGRDWTGHAGATDAELDELRKAMPVSLPERFYELLATNNGGYGPLSKQPCYFVLKPIADILDIFHEDRLMKAKFPDYIFFGTSGGSDWLAFDTRTGPPYRIVVTEFLADPDEVQEVASDFDGFVELVGYEDPEVWADYEKP